MVESAGSRILSYRDCQVKLGNGSMPSTLYPLFSSMHLHTLFVVACIRFVHKLVHTLIPVHLGICCVSNNLSFYRLPNKVAFTLLAMVMVDSLG